MGPVDIAVIVVVGIAVIGIAVYLIYRKVKHKGGCCDCSFCGGNCSCCKKEDKEN
ncbi:MAG: FeoB-associated Cys-rich membrane protein [Clostridia bacterium]|nr:FeoB-associated Cys-rich membrane protein [Clostridia bacterium]